MKLQFRSVKELSGRTKLWYRSRRVYTHAGFVCRRPYRTCEWLERICENRSLSDFSQRAANVGESSEQKPERMLLLKTPSSRSRSEAFVKPHQAGDAYNIICMLMTLNFTFRSNRLVFTNLQKLFLQPSVTLFLGHTTTNSCSIHLKLNCFWLVLHSRGRSFPMSLRFLSAIPLFQ